ncbi:MAG: 3-hydroxyacyl-ACP dehydratase FabZ [Candidatus Gastranaerophilales bacterium]|nr:3-hydroxyacyl-ACP dehydratase FabZ [Candidatus Gastranaerophilales bacterium]
MTENQEQAISLNVMEIMEMIPHRYPFLLVDAITECVPGKYSKGYKNLTMNEAFFQGHFPGNPVMPGVLQLEALAQCSAPILMSMPEYKGKLTLYAGADNVRWKSIVRPGDKLEMHVELTKAKGPICKCHGVGTVNGKVAIEADMTVAIK